MEEEWDGDENRVRGDVRKGQTDRKNVRQEEVVVQTKAEMWKIQRGGKSR